MIHLFERLPQFDATQPELAVQPAPPVRSEPLVGLIRNPRSHGHARADDPAASLPGVITAAPSQRNELPQILADFAARQVDYIAIDGGDGTVRDVLSCGAGVFGDAWPTLILLPSGKTNALAYDLGVPRLWPLAEALQAARRDSHVIRRPLVVAQADDELSQVRGFVMGAGVFTRSISLGQDAHRYGAFNAAAVAVTALWSVLQAFFGGKNNPWRQTARLALRTGDGQEMAHSGGSPASDRFMVFASSLEGFPAGLRPFGELQAPVRLAVLDNPRRSVLLRLPLIFRGHISQTVLRKGMHLYGGEQFEIELSEAFILDGEAFPPGHYRVFAGPRLRFIVP
ncbi:MAG: diacylglycerol kinase family protein [Alteraurantiacibacter sp.]